MTHLLAFIFSVFGGIAAVAIDLFIWLELSHHAEKSLGGAYCAMFGITAPFVFAVGAILSWYAFYKIINGR